MKISIEKTEVALFSLNNKDSNVQPEVFINGSLLKVNKTPKFIGVTFDRSLTFATHLKEVNAKALKRSNIPKALSGKDWGCNDDSLRSLYLTYIRATIEYAGGAWMPCVSDTNLEKLEITLRKMARTITGCAPGTTNDALIREANLIPLNCRKKITATKLFEKAQHLL